MSTQFWAVIEFCSISESKCSIFQGNAEAPPEEQWEGSRVLFFQTDFCSKHGLFRSGSQRWCRDHDGGVFEMCDRKEDTLIVTRTVIQVIFVHWWWCRCICSWKRITISILSSISSAGPRDWSQSSNCTGGGRVGVADLFARDFVGMSGQKMIITWASRFDIRVSASKVLEATSKQQALTHDTGSWEAGCGGGEVE